MAKERALDLFQLLGQIDRKDYHIWQSLTSEQQKEFSAYMTLMWMAGTTDPFQILMLNEVVNTTLFSLPEHRELMLKLLAVCSNGQSKRYTWVKYKLGGNGTKVKLAIKLLMEHHRYSEKEAEDVYPLYSTAELIELAESQGWQKDELKDLAKELK